MQEIIKSAYKHKIAPGPNGNLFLGSLPELQRKGQLQFYLDAWQQFGDVVRFRMGPLVVHLIAHPDAIQHILLENHQHYCKGIAFKRLREFLGLGLLSSEGELWQRQRRLMQPFFTEKAIQQFGIAMTDTTEEMLQRWQISVEHGATMEIGLEMLSLTISIIGKTMFSQNICDERTQIGQELRKTLDLFSQRVLKPFNLPLFIPTPSNCPFNRGKHIIDRFIYKVIEEHRSGTIKNDDILSKLLQVRDDESGKGFSEKQLRDEAITIFVAGSETTATTLTWTWYLLSKHPEVRNKLYAELTQVLGGRTPTAEDIPQLKYTRMVIEETMRLYPPVWATSRDATEDDEISGYHIRAGSMVIMSQYIAHRHPAYWSNPEKFDPDRFAPEQSKSRPYYAYFPFGIGQRRCLGFHFAMLQAQLILATVAQRYQLDTVSEHLVEPEAVSTLQPRYGLMMSVQPR